MKSLQYIGITVLAVLMFAGTNLQAQDKAKERIEVVTSSKVEKAKLKKAAKQEVFDAKSADRVKQAKKQGQVQKAGLRKSNNLRSKEGEARAKEKIAKKRMEANRMRMASSGEANQVKRAEQALKDGQRAVTALRKRKATAEQKFEIEKKSGKLSKEEIAKKEEILLKIEAEISELEKVVAQEKESLSKMVRANSN